MDRTDDDGRPLPPPCRAASRYMVTCPLCGRRLQIKTLRYSHVCRRSFNAFERSLEQKRETEMVLAARLGQQQQQIEQSTDQSTEQPVEQSPGKYDHLLYF